SAPGRCKSLNVFSSGRPFRDGALARFKRAQRENLTRVQEPVGVEDALYPHLDRKVGRGELHLHEVALLDADPVLARETATDRDAELQDLCAGELGVVGFVRVVGIVKYERVQISITRME